MNKREMLLDVLEYIEQRCQRLKEPVNNLSGEELENILDEHFAEFGTNIHIIFNFMQMIVTRINESEFSETGRKSIMSNKELIKYFDAHWQ